MRTKRVITKHDRVVIATVVSVILLIAITLSYLIFDTTQPTSTQSPELLAKQYTMLSLNIIEAEQSVPILSMFIFFVVNIAGALYVSYITSRLSLYPIVTKYPIVLFCVTSVAIASYEPHRLLSAATILISLFAFGNLLSVNEERAGDYSHSAGEHSDATSSSSRLFSAAFYLGLLALLHPAAIILGVAIPMLLFFYNRPPQEFLIMVIAFILPTALEGYLRWIMGYTLPEIANHYTSLLMRDGSILFSPTILWETIRSRWILSLELLLITLLSLLGIVKLGSVSLSARSLQRYGAMISTWVLMMLMILSSAYSVTSWVMMAIPISIMTTMAFITTRKWISIMMVSAVVGLALGAIFVGH